jgi:hypothetical protein
MPERWFVAFGDGVYGAAPWWVRWFTRPGFRHVWAFAYAPEADAWLLVFPTFERVRVELADKAEITALIAAARAGAIRVLEVTPQAAGPRRPRLVVTCAGAIAAIVGIRRTTLRPEGLFRHLIACGAKPVFTPVPEPDSGKPVQPAEACSQHRA